MNAKTSQTVIDSLKSKLDRHYSLHPTLAGRVQKQHAVGFNELKAYYEEISGQTYHPSFDARIGLAH